MARFTLRDTPYLPGPSDQCDADTCCVFAVTNAISLLVAKQTGKIKYYSKQQIIEGNEQPTERGGMYVALPIESILLYARDIGVCEEEDYIRPYLEGQIYSFSLQHKHLSVKIKQYECIIGESKTLKEESIQRGAVIALMHTCGSFDTFSGEGLYKVTKLEEGEREDQMEEGEREDQMVEGERKARMVKTRGRLG